MPLHRSAWHGVFTKAAFFLHIWQQSAGDSSLGCSLHPAHSSLRAEWAARWNKLSGSSLIRYRQHDQSLWIQATTWLNVRAKRSRYNQCLTMVIHWEIWNVSVIVASLPSCFYAGLETQQESIMLVALDGCNQTQLRSSNHTQSLLWIPNKSRPQTNAHFCVGSSALNYYDWCLYEIAEIKILKGIEGEPRCGIVHRLRDFPLDPVSPEMILCQCM